MHAILTGRRLPALAAAAVLAAACGGETPVGLGSSPENTSAPAAFRAGVEFSSADAAPGGTVEIGVGLDGALPAGLGALQGSLRYDSSKLEYVGLEADQPGFVMVNADARPGAVRFSAIQLPALDRSAATFVFRVKSADYVRGLAFEFEEAATTTDRIFTSAGAFAPRRSPDTIVGEAVSPRSLAEYTARAEAALGLPARQGPEIAARAGDATIYGDVNSSGTVTSGDLALVAGATVGNNIVVDTLATRDIALGGNLRPLNNADGITVGFGDPCPLGVTCTAGPNFQITNAGAITSADQLAIANFLVGNPSAGVGVAIPKSATAGNRVIISGTLDEARCTATPADCNWTRGNIYQLDGRVVVDNGGVLNIESGTRVEGNTAIVPSSLIIRRRGQIFARGERTAPIVFTCTGAKTRGCWGGIVVLGNAPVNEQGSGAAPAITDPVRNPSGTGNTRIIEGTTDEVFGGNNPTDNSGVIRFAIIEYGGFIIGANNELNNLTLGGVGSGTTIEYVQVHGGLDDGYELFGGTVNARYLYITGNSDDGFDWSFGWQGAAQFVIIQQDSLDAEKGWEGDNTESSGTYGNTPRTNGPLYNFTAVGTLYPASTSGNAGNNVNDAIHIRRGNGSQIANSIVIGFPFILDLDDAATCTGSATTDPEVRNSYLGGFSGGAGNTDTGDPVCARNAADETAVLSNPAVNNTIVADIATAQLVLRRGFDLLAPDFRPRENAQGLPAPSAPPTVNPGNFIVATSYVGAVEPESPTTRNNLPWYAGWTRRWQNATTP